MDQNRRPCFLIKRAAALAVIAAAIALRIHDSDATATMHKKVRPEPQEITSDQMPGLEQTPVTVNLETRPAKRGA